MTIPEDHPRYTSLKIREALVSGLRMGITSETGLIAHGRGEAFDYLIGERTSEPAMKAIEVAAARLLSARHPVLSVNGNVAALAPFHMLDLANRLGCLVEVNLFHRTEGRVERIGSHLRRIAEENGMEVGILAEGADGVIEGLSSRRSVCHKEGILGSDVVLVPLEDGDRAETLVAAGKIVITVDLNPMSRTARMAHITIVDNLVRAIPSLITVLEDLRGRDPSVLEVMMDGFHNDSVLDSSHRMMLEGLGRW